MEPAVIFPCGCRYDQLTEHRYCEDHLVVEVVREGASLRTADEQLAQFVKDAIALLENTDGGQVRSRWKVTLEEVDEDFASDHGHSVCRWLDNEVLREELEEAMHEAESALHDAGFVTFWNDGYVIAVPVAGNPIDHYEEHP